MSPHLTSSRSCHRPGGERLRATLCRRGLCHLAAGGPYRLASGDRLRIIVFGQDNLSNVYAVDGSGRISMPLIAAIEAQGRTTQQLERAIESKLRGGYLREPKVSVEVDTYRPSSCWAKSPIPASSPSSTA
jgi:protein involved in polysaccharide export with SLBB domain